MVTTTEAQSHLSRTRSPGVTLFAKRSLMLGLGLVTRYQRRRDYRGCNQEPCEGPVERRVSEHVSLWTCACACTGEEGKKGRRLQRASAVCLMMLLWCVLLLFFGDDDWVSTTTPRPTASYILRVPWAFRHVGFSARSRHARQVQTLQQTREPATR
jgi:hypothetical protein